jgi:superfamily II DNA or RNA helicase
MVTTLCPSQEAAQRLCQTVRRFVKSATLRKDLSMSKTPTLREWQRSAIEKLLKNWDESPDSRPLVAACPGAGKTLFSCAAAQWLLINKGVEVVIVVCPTVNIKAQWKEQFNRFSIDAVDEASNEAFRTRRSNGSHLTGGRTVICLTYNQISIDKGLFVEICRRYKTFVIADEVHHADDSAAFGEALSDIAHQASFRLALSGTPFNSTGGALAMCESTEELNDVGRLVRKAKPLVRYSYGEAIRDMACRPVEFVKVMGQSVSTYRSLADNSLFQRLIDLARHNKTDSLGAILDPNGDFMRDMVLDALKALGDIRRHDKSAGMLVVAKDKDHGAAVARLIESMCKKNDAWKLFSVLEIYNDTPKAHERIKALNNDSTSIVITVRMISEGVDVKRLRVGLYATDYLTQMFFIQFVGRFIRWEDRLDGSQHARIIIPGHVTLLEFAREIEKMVDEALIPEETDGGGGGGIKNEFVSNETKKNADGVMWRGKETLDRDLAEAFFKAHPSLRGTISEYQAIQAAKDANMNGASHQSSAPAGGENWRKKNETIVRAAVRIMKANGETDENLFAKVQRRANAAVGIDKVDDLITDEKLIERHQFLLNLIRAIRKGDANVD